MKNQIPDNYEIVEAVTFEGEPEQWIVLCNGFQIGGISDTSGAGDLTFSSLQKAISFVLTINLTK